MKIQEYLSQSGNDFTAKLVCEACGTTATLRTGYHDAHYHVHVIPNINCPTCDRNHYGESSELGDVRRAREGVSKTPVFDAKEHEDVKAWDKTDGEQP